MATFSLLVFPCYCQIVNSSWTPATNESQYSGAMTDLVIVECLLPDSPVRRTQYDKNIEGIPAAGLMISVSNNGLHQSKRKLKFISYDSVCMACNVFTGCVLKVSWTLLSCLCLFEMLSTKKEYEMSDVCTMLVTKSCAEEVADPVWFRENSKNESSWSHTTWCFFFFNWINPCHAKKLNSWCLLVLRYGIVVWVLFSVFSIFHITSFDDRTLPQHQ